MKTFFFIVVGLVIGLAAGYYFSKVPAVIPTTQTATVTVIAPKPVAESKPKIVYKDTPIYRDTGTYKIVVIHDSIPIEIPADTAAIVADYLLQRDYVIDTTLNEVHAVFKPSVFANKLAIADISITNLRNKDPTWNFKAGITTGVNDFTPSVLIENKKFSYQISYDLIGEEKGVRAGIFYDF